MMLDIENTYMQVHHLFSRAKHLKHKFDSLENQTKNLNPSPSITGRTHRTRTNLGRILCPNQEGRDHPKCMDSLGNMMLQ